MTPLPRATARAPALPRWLSQKVVFLGVLLVVFAAYTEIAFGMEWRTEAGRIGAGFFPRIVGLLAIVTIVVSLFREVRTLAGGSDDGAGGARAGTDTRHPLAVVLMILAGAVASYWFLLLGAVVTGIVFLIGVLWFMDPQHRVRGVLLGITLPVGMYLVFQTGLNAGLPDGILPMP